MDMTQLNQLTDEQKQAYMELARVFSEPGWKRIAKTYEDKAEAMKNAGANAGSWEENRVAYGLRMAYEEVAGLEDIMESLYSQISDTATEAQELVDEEEYE